MWSIWPELPAYGRKAAQFVDLLGYFSLKTQQTEKKVRCHSEKEVQHPRSCCFVSFMLVLVYDTAGTDFLSKELLGEIVFYSQNLNVKKGRVLKKLGSVDFLFCCFGIFWFCDFFFIWKKTSFPQEAVVGKYIYLLAVIHRFLILQLLEIFCNHDFWTKEVVGFLRGQVGLRTII